MRNIIKMKKPIIMYKFGEPTMIQREDGSYVDNLEEWDEIIKRTEETK